MTGYRAHHLANGQPKARWATRKTARGVARTYETQTGTRFFAYRCDCGGFHVGHVMRDANGNITRNREDQS